MVKKCIFICVIFGYFAVFKQLRFYDEKLHIIFCDIGQGDGVILWKGSTQVIIDGGKNSIFLECLGKNMPVFDRTIEVVVATHPDEDHIGILAEVFNRYKVDQIITTPVIRDEYFFWKYLESVRKHADTVRFLTFPDMFSIERVEYAVVWPQEILGDRELFLYGENIHILEEKARFESGYNDNTNGGSIVVRLKFGDFSALFTGDLGIKEEKMLISSGRIGKTTLLKLGHHGSHGSTSREFLEELSPDLAIISVGKDNTYGHPSEKILDLLDNFKILTYRTDIHGDIEIVTDGAGYEIKPQRLL